MKVTTTTSQNGFYHNQGWIFFEGFFDVEQIEEIKKDTDSSLKSHDLWREFQSVKDMVNKQIAPTILSLINKKTLRIAFDHYFHPSKAQFRKDSNQFSSKEIYIEDLFSIQGLLAGAIIPLTDGFHRTTHIENQSPFTWKRGDLFIFSEDLPMDFGQLVCEKNFSFLLVTFGGVSLVYTHNENNPDGDYLKRMGYSPGDRLLDNTHPCIRNKTF